MYGYIRSANDDPPSILRYHSHVSDGLVLRRTPVCQQKIVFPVGCKERWEHPDNEVWISYVACSQYKRGRNTPSIYALPNTFHGSYMFDFDLF